MLKKLIKVNYDENALYWSCQTLMSTARDIMVAQSIRGTGKSFSVDTALIKAITKLGFNCVISRWDDGELSIARELVEYDSDFEKTQLNTSAYRYTYKNNGASLYFFAVKMAHKHKGLDIKDLKFWFYDEFIPEFYENRTRKIEEVKKFNSLYTTLRRNNENFRVILCCNVITWFNGFYEQWGIEPFPQGYIGIFEIEKKVDIKGEIKTMKFQVAVENVEPTKAQIERVIRDEIMKGGNSDVLSYLQNVTKDNTSMITDCPDMSIPLHNAEWYFEKKCYSFRLYDGLMYWVETKPRNVNKWTLNTSDITDEIHRDKAMGLTFEKYYDQSRMRFHDGNIEQVVISMIWAGRKRLD